MKFIYFPFTVIAIVLTSLNGCASKNSIQMKHISTIQQWKSSAYQTNTSLFKYSGIHFLAQLSIRYTPSGDEFELDGFTIAKDIPANSIDLLDPHFSKVRACSWKCYYLGDIIDSNSMSAQTYLTRFYEVNKSKLNQFYDSVNKVNLSILNQSADKQKLFIDKLMLGESNQFDDLAVFESFIVNAYGDAVVGDSKAILLRGDRKLAYANAKLSYIQSPIGKIYNTHSYRATITNASKEKTFNNKDLIQDQTVCSIQENNFGNVTKIDGDKITVHLIGQVKMDNDGVYVLPSPGYLFDTLDSFAYVDIDIVKVFNRKDLFKCDVGDD